MLALHGYNSLEHFALVLWRTLFPLIAGPLELRIGLELVGDRLASLGVLQRERRVDLGCVIEPDLRGPDVLVGLPSAHKLANEGCPVCRGHLLEVRVAEPGNAGDLCASSLLLLWKVRHGGFQSLQSGVSRPNESDGLRVILSVPCAEEGVECGGVGLVRGHGLERLVRGGDRLVAMGEAGEGNGGVRLVAARGGRRGGKLRRGRSRSIAGPTAAAI